MSTLSRGRNPSSIKSESRDGKKGSSDSDDDLIFIASSKQKLKASNPEAESGATAIHKSSHLQKKPTKVKLLKSKKEDETQKRQDIQEAPSEEEVAYPDINDTLLALEEQIGRRFDENSQPGQSCFDIVVESETETSEPAHQSNPVTQVVCPFCWKKLHDKLTGMTHVKACGKALPIERIFEALQLHEKQIKEWERIGISYPGFQGANTKPKPSANAKAEGAGKGQTKRAAGNPRRKKPTVAEDPDFDLAMALSASLQEEVVERQKAEINYLSEVGLHGEAVEIAKASDIIAEGPELEAQEPHRRVETAISEFRLRFSKDTKKLQKVQPGKPQPQPSIKSRGVRTRNKDLKNTKLFTLNEDQKAVMVAERVAQILESSEQRHIDFEEPYKLIESNLESMVCNGRLKEFCDEKPKLWRMASDMTEFPNEDFYTPALKDCKVQTTEEVNKEANGDSKNVTNEEAVTKFEERCAIRKPIPRELARAKRIERKSESFSGLTSSSREMIENRKENNNRTGICKLGQDFLRLFTKKICTDLTLYGREERPIRAHKLIIQARCPKLLQDVVIEEHSNGRKSELIPLTCFSHMAVKSFTWYLYSGQLFPCTTSSDSEQMACYLEEMEELAQKYNIRLDESEHQVTKKQLTEECRHSNLEKIDQEVQTDAISANTEFILSETGKLEANTSDCKSEEIYETEFDSFDIEFNSRIDYGRTDCLENVKMKENNYEPSLNLTKEVTIVENVNIARRKSTDSNSSVDFIEDSDDDTAFDTQKQEVTEIKMTMSDDSLETAKKKRSRSLSPRFEDAILLSDSPFSQANKKHKLDLTSDANPLIPSSPAIVDKSDDEVLVPSLSDREKKALSDDVFNEILTPTPCTSKHVTDGSNGHRAANIQDMISPVSRHSVSATNIKSNSSYSRLSQTRRVLQLESSLNDKTITNQSFQPSVNLAPSTPPPHSPLNLNNFSFGYLNYDNHFQFNQEPSMNAWIGDDNDDSILARIPEEILQMRSSPDSSAPAFPFSYPSAANFSPQLSPIPPVHTSPVVNYVSRTTRNKNDNDNIIETDSKKKGKSKAKGGGGGKKTGSSSQPLQQRNTYEENLAVYNQNFPPTPAQPQAAISRRECAVNQTPMLNYSTIDTPILKRELKKYGLKPLPRTKAKLLLRHIYKETHKSDDDE